MDQLHPALDLVRDRLRTTSGLFVLGICGAQGSGKTTLAAEMAKQLEADSVATAQLSVDDLYLTRAERLRLASEVHPLFATRGVPGTHDVALGMQVLDALERGEAAPLPRFDKAQDDRETPENWPNAPANCRVLLFEGWCLGAVPQPEAELTEPVNALEAIEDPDAVWRHHANVCLAGDYQLLFDRIDALVMLAAPSFSVVSQWRLQQEQGLMPGGGVMDEAGIRHFIQFYQRLTEWMLREMPGRADLVARLDEDRRVLSLT
ncbi:MAG: kinase [Novosphingobium sp.]